jgi:divalent metal cation (Fe/Co/Zn/Cd) transporter
VVLVLLILNASWKIVTPALAELCGKVAPADRRAQIHEVPAAVTQVQDVHAENI